MILLRSRTWNGVPFCGVLPFPSPMINPDLVFDNERLLSVPEPYDSSNVFRVTLDHVSGSLVSYTMNSRKDKWNVAFTTPRDACDEYGLCGPNGICRIDKPVPCECLKGFVPKFQKEWDNLVWSGGCTRITSLNCKNGDGFLEVGKVKYPDKLKFRLNTNMRLDECKTECLKYCSCTAYANPYITNGGSGCMMWFGDLTDTREFTGADSMQNIYIRLPRPELADYSNNDRENEKRKKIPIRLINGCIFL